MARKVFYKKRKNLPGWVQFYTLWIIIFVVTGVCINWFGLNEVEKVSRIKPISQDILLVRNKNKMKQQAKWLKILQNSNLILHLKNNKTKYLLNNLEINFINEVSSVGKCNYIKLYSSTKNNATLWIENIGKNEDLIKKLLTTFISQEYFNRYSTNVILVQNPKKCSKTKIFQEILNEKKARLFIELKESIGIRKNLLYYGKNMLLPSVELAGILEGYQSYSIREQIYYGLSNFELNKFSQMINGGHSAFMINTATTVPNKLSDNAIIKLVENTIKLKPRENTRVWLSQTSSLSSTSYKVILVLLLLLSFFPLISRLSSREKVHLSEAIISTVFFSVFGGLQITTIYLLSLINASLILFIVMATLDVLLIIFLAKKLEKKLFAVRFNTASALIPVLFFHIILFFSNSAVFLFLVPCLFIFSQIKSASPRKSILMFIIFIGYFSLFFILPMFNCFDSSTSSVMLLEFFNHTTSYLILLSFVIGSYLALISKNNKTKGYF